MAYSECLPARLNPLAERTCSPQVLHESLSGVKPFAAGSVDIIDILSAIKKDEPADLRDITDLGAVDDAVAELILRGPPGRGVFRRS